MLLGGLVNPGGYTVMWLADLRITREGWAEQDLFDMLVFFAVYTLPCLIMTGSALWRFRAGRGARPLAASLTGFGIASATMIACATLGLWVMATFYDAPPDLFGLMRAPLDIMQMLVSVLYVAAIYALAIGLPCCLVTWLLLRLATRRDDGGVGNT